MTLKRTCSRIKSLYVSYETNKSPVKIAQISEYRTFLFGALQ